MRRVLLAIVVVGLGTAGTSAQSGPPDRPVGLYTVGADGAPSSQPLTGETTLDTEVSGMWKAMVPFGGGGPAVKYKFAGASSAVQGGAATAVMLYLDPQAMRRGGSMNIEGDPMLYQIRDAKGVALFALTVEADVRLLDKSRRLDSVSERVRPNVYRLAPKQPLAPGEYAWGLVMGRDPMGIIYPFTVSAAR